MTTTERVMSFDPKLGVSLLGRGLAALLFSVLAIAGPRMSLRGLATLFALYLLVDSVFMLYSANRARRAHVTFRSRPLAIEGIANLCAAVLAIAYPVLGVLRVVAGVRALIVGASDVLWSRHDKEHDLIVELGGAVAITFGIVILGWPGPGIVALPWLLGTSAMVSGGLLIAGSLARLTSADLDEKSRLA